jgi:hypothetical protein
MRLASIRTKRRGAQYRARAGTHACDAFNLMAVIYEEPAVKSAPIRLHHRPNRGAADGRHRPPANAGPRSTSGGGRRDAWAILITGLRLSAGKFCVPVKNSMNSWLCRLRRPLACESCLFLGIPISNSASCADRRQWSGCGDPPPPRACSTPSPQSWLIGIQFTACSA